METHELNVDFSIDKSALVNERYLPKNEFDLQTEEIRRNGYTILKNRLKSEEIEYAKQKVDEIYELQAKEMGGEDILIQIGEQGLARNLIQYDDFFLKLVVHEDILAFMKHFMGEYYTLFQFNGNLNIPNLPATSTPWHRDLTFRHFTSSRPLCMTAIWVLDEFNEGNDGISLLRSSHLHDIFPSFEYVEKYQQKLFVKAGSVVVLDGLLFHRSGFNSSKSRRRVCQGMYVLPFMLQQISIPNNVNEKYQRDPFLRWLFGYNNMQQDSVLKWRKEKLENKRKNLDKKTMIY